MITVLSFLIGIDRRANIFLDMFGRVVVFGCLMGLALSIGFVTSGTATCVSRVGATGPCNKWIFNSSKLYTGPIPSCFPGNAKVRT